MKHELWRKILILLPAAGAVFASLLYCFWTVDFFFISRSERQSDDEILSATHTPLINGAVSGHGNGNGVTEQSSLDLPNFTSLLHPQNHTHRKAHRVELQWNITAGIRRPDGVAKMVYLVNGEFPAPVIEVRSGDELVVNVRNQLEDEDVAIHWHGLRIANEMDGVVGLTQCGISPRREMRYQLDIPDDGAGTFWWHSHSETQRADGLFGALIVHDPDNGGEEGVEATKYEYEEEQVLMVGDWYHRPAREVLASYLDWTNFKIQPAPDSLLINGMGHFNCSMAIKARPLDCQQARFPSLVVGERTRMRIINVGALTGISIATAGYSMTAIQVDGGNAVEAITSSSIGILYPGERVDVIFERQGNTAASIEISIDRENMGFPNLALTAEQTFAIEPSATDSKMEPQTAVVAQERGGERPDVERIDLSRLSGKSLVPEVFKHEAGHTILLYATISYMTRYQYRPKGFFNHTSWEPSVSTKSPLATLNRTEWPETPHELIPEVRQGKTVDLVINNIDDKGHPLHLHGHDFLVVAQYRPGRVGTFQQYNPFDKDKEPAGGDMNLRNPVIKDTVYVPAAGYVVLRLRADSPGLWLLHCHVLWHSAVGMNMALEVADASGSAFNDAARERVAQVCGS